MGRIGSQYDTVLIDVRQRIFGAQRDLSKGRYDYVLARIRIKAAAGTLGEGDIELVNRWLTAAQ